MKLFLAILLVVGIVAALKTLLSSNSPLRGLGGSGRPVFKCATCRHCRKLFDDGSRCSFGRSEVFMTETAINNCIDHERVRR